VGGEDVVGVAVGHLGEEDRRIVNQFESVDGEEGEMMQDLGVLEGLQFLRSAARGGPLGSLFGGFHSVTPQGQ
jgi:hypothetical protein